MEYIYLINGVFVLIIVILLNYFKQSKKNLRNIYLPLKLFNEIDVFKFNKTLTYKFLKLHVILSYYLWQFISLYLFSIYLIDWIELYMLISATCLVAVPIFTYIYVLLQIKVHFTE